MEERALALKAKKPELDDLRSALGIDRIKVQVEELEQQAAQPGFWDDAEKSLDELEDLADTAGAVCVGRILQKREGLHPAGTAGCSCSSTGCSCPATGISSRYSGRR